jgi:hypothetical protein
MSFKDLLPDDEATRKNQYDSSTAYRLWLRKQTEAMSH